MNAMRIFGYNAQRNITYHIMSEIDKTESGKIQFEEFLKIMIDNLRPCDSDKQEDYERVFQYFVNEESFKLGSDAYHKKGKGDAGLFKMNQKDFFTKKELKKMALEINENITPEELESIFKRFDPERHEKCTFISFYKCMQEVVQKKYR